MGVNVLGGIYVMIILQGEITFNEDGNRQLNVLGLGQFRNGMQVHS